MISHLYKRLHKRAGNTTIKQSNISMFVLDLTVTYTATTPEPAIYMIKSKKRRSLNFPSKSNRLSSKAGVFERGKTTRVRMVFQA